VNITVIILLLICLANLFLGLFVLLRNSKSKVGRSFFVIAALIDCWAISNYLTDNAHHFSLNVLFNKLSYLFAFLAIVMAAVFTGYFSNRLRRYSTRSALLGVTGVVIIGALSVTSYVAGSVTKASNAKLTFSNGSLIFFYDLVIIGILASIIWDLYTLRRKGDHIQRSQANLVLGGFTACILLGLLTNAILPSLTDSFQTAKFGPPLLSLFLVASITYAIVRHRLFDIRSFVVRAVTYVAAFFIVALLYVVPTVIFTTVLFHASLGTGAFILLSLVALITAISFQPLRSRFNQLTSRLFFRDYYEPQEVLDKLSNFLVGSVEVDRIERGSARIISQALKPTFLRYALVADKEQSGNPLLRSLMHQDTSLVVLDEFETGRHQDLQDIMRGQDVAVAVRLRTTHEVLGYMVIGFKQSGGLYTPTDRRLLNIAADEIAISLQNALRFEEIQRFNITLQEKIEAATKQLRQANERLKELDQTKDEFISMASHQLRTPLTTVKGYVSMVLDGDAGRIKKEQRDLLQHAFDGANRMVYLIADLLNVSRLQSGKFVIENKPTNLAEVVATEVSQLQEAAANHQLKLTYHKPEKFPVINVDETKIRQVVMNFLDNALYYTPAGGRVDVNLQATDKEVIYTVTDTGLGVPKAEQHHLFSKFYRAGNARRMRPDGTGLGLFMAKKVVVAQGGAIIFKSTEGKGSTFGFSLPRAAVEVKA